MINPRWLELPLSRTNFHGPKGVRAIEVRLYCIENHIFFSNIDRQALTEIQNQCQEYKTVAQVAEVERDKLMDLMKVLQKR